MTPRPPFDELLALFRATVAREGVTTAPGNIAGNTIIDGALAGVGVDSFRSMLIILFPGDFNNVDSADVTAFDNVNGEITFDHPYKSVAAAIPAGVPYKIVTFRFVPAEVAAIAVALAAHEAAQLASRGEVTSIETKVDDLDADLVIHEAALAAHEAAQLASRAALGTHDVDIKALLAAIAGYIDTEIGTIITSQGRQLFRKVKWSEGKVQVQIDAAGATTVLPTITIDNLPVGAVVVEAHLMFKFRMIENKYAGVNKLNGPTVALTSQVFQIQDDGGGAWADGINFVDDYFTLASEAREGGDVIPGTLNVGVADVVDGNDTYNVRLLLGKADQDFINFDDCQVGLDIWYSV